MRPSPPDKEEFLQRIWEIISTPDSLLKPAIDGDDHLVATSGSRANASHRGDNGHPCLIPQNRGKGSVRSPFMRSLAVGATYNNFTQLINLSPSPKQLSTSHR